MSDRDSAAHPSASGQPSGSAGRSAQGSDRFRRILVLTGDHSLPDTTKWDGRYDEEDLVLHRQMRAALESLPGYDFEFLSSHDRLLARLSDDPPDFVLNLCDTGFRNVATQELHVPALLELMGIPYSGAPPAAMAICYDKGLVRMAADSLRIPTPREVYLAPEDSLVEDSVVFPALIKPNQADGSVGIGRDAVVKSAAEAASTLRWLRETLPGKAALIQEYLPGTEYGLALIGNPGFGFEALPPLEVDFSALPDGLPPILSFESKTAPDSPYSRISIKPAQLPEEAVARLRRQAEILFERLQLRDYARFDFRTGADGTIKLMEVNPNPAWSAAAKLAIMAGFAGKSYSELFAMLLEAARRRLGRVETPES